MKILVVGSSGFIGQALLARLTQDGHQVEAWSRRGGSSTVSLQSRTVDLLGSAPLPPPEGAPWDAAIHLAAHAIPGQAWTSDRVGENLRMTARVLDHLVQHASGCRLLLISSGQVYAPSEAPRQESDPLDPRHPYGLSKRLSEDWALYHRGALDVQVVRPFNQIGPGMPSGLLIPDLLTRIASDEATIAMRGRDDIKDFLDWRDAMEGYLALLKVTAPSGSLWNLCSGRGTRVSTLISELQSMMGDSRAVTFADSRQESLVGSPAKLKEATGWSPRHALRETLQALVSGAI